MSVDSYRIADEPSPGAMAHLAVSPLWPFIAIMFGGVWISWSWFVLNGIVVGSPSRRREWIWVGVGLLVSGMLAYALLDFAAQGVIAENKIKYAGLVLVAWKLGVTYALFALQSHSIELYEYYGGKLRNGVFVVAATYFIAPGVLGTLPGYLRLMMV